MPISIANSGEAKPITPVPIDPRISGSKIRGGINLQIGTAVYRCETTPPFAMNALRTDEGWRFFPTDISGGLRGGDRVGHNITLESNARVLWTPPAATLFFPGLNGIDPTLVASKIDLAPGARLIAMNRVSIPCMGARLFQTTELRIAKNSDLLWLDLWCSGREAAGERWAFDQLDNDLSHFVDGELCYREKWKLNFGSIPEGPSGFRGFGTMWTVILHTGAAADGWDPRAAFSRHIHSLGGISEWGEIGTGTSILKGLTPYGRSDLPPISLVT